MVPIRNRRQLAALLERQMAAASARLPSTPDEDVDGRTALKTYLLETHGRMREEPAAALVEPAARAGLEVQPTEESELIALAQDDLWFWLDTSGRRFVLLYTTASAKDADRVHEALVSATPLLEPVWALPAQLEALPVNTGGRTVLFSLRHDRRPLRREAFEDSPGVDFVTLRFWAPSALETLGRLRASDVLPGATSVSSVRVRLGEPGAHAVVEAFHNGKFTSIGASFAQHERLVRSALEEHIAFARATEAHADGGRRITAQVRWTMPELPYAVAKMFSGADPFRLWALPHASAEGTFRARAVDTGTGSIATYEVGPNGVALELDPGTPAGVAIRFLANLQYHVHADAGAELIPLTLAASSARTTRKTRPLPFDERAALEDVARVILVEACAQWLRGTTTVSAAVLAGAPSGVVPTPAMADLCRQVMSEAAAYEWRERIKPVIAPDGSMQWRWLDPPPADGSARTRDLIKLNKQAQQLIARLSGGVVAPWLQLSLFDAETLVPPAADE